MLRSVCFCDTGDGMIGGTAAMERMSAVGLGGDWQSEIVEGSEMDLMENAQRLRIYIGEADKHKGRPLYVAILEMLRREGYAGATAIRGVAGFGHASRMHTAAILRLSEDLPVVIDVVDHVDRIGDLLLRLEDLDTNGLVTVEDVEVLRYGTHKSR